MPGMSVSAQVMGMDPGGCCGADRGDCGGADEGGWMKKYVQTIEGRKEASEALLDHPIGEYGFCFEIIQNKRTVRQNSAIHKYYSLLADQLNAGGLDMRKLLKPGVEIPWTPETVKENLWKPIQEAVMGELSTTKLNRSQVSEVYDVLTRHLIEKHNVYVEFPSNER
jgi:hypothetical protein